MPGIAGLITSNPVRAELLLPMVSSLAHEDEYSTGIYRNPTLGIHIGWVHHRDSFDDCSPIWNEARDVCLFLTGDVFTEASELDELRRRGHSIGKADGSHLVHMYEEHDKNFVERLNGRFSGLLIDLRQSSAILFNDRFGAGRIYFHETTDGLYFSSEAKSLLRALPETRKLDNAAVAETFSFGCVLRNRTLFSGISLLPPASRWLIHRMDQIERDIYFDRRTWEHQSELSDDNFYEALRDTFSALLPQYLQGPGTTGMSLTGGLDGRMIMAWGKPAPGLLPCYSFGGTYRDCEDVRIARVIASACGQTHQTIIAGPELLSQFPELAARCIQVSDGTMDVSGAVELYVNRAARAIAPIRLTGNYGSEIVRGNVAFRPEKLNSQLFDPELCRNIVAAVETYRVERAVRDLSFIAFKQVPWYHNARLSVEQSQLMVRSPFLDNRLVKLMYRASKFAFRNTELSLKLIHEGNPTLAKIPTDRGIRYGRPRIGDRLKQAAMEFTAKAEYAYDYGMPNWLARVDSALPSLGLERMFLGRHKFYHFRIWYRRQLAPYVREMLHSPNAAVRSLYRAGVLEAMITAHANGSENHTLDIHRALTLELIHQHLLSSPDTSHLAQQCCS